jgi:hypothetical protein
MRDKRGSAIVMALITVLFIAIIGSILLYTSYIGHSIKAAQSHGEQGFYRTETALDQVRAGIQGAVAGCIEDAYTDALFTATSQTDIQTRFTAAFEKHFLDWEFDDPTNMDPPVLFISQITGARYRYDLGVLRSFIAAPPGVTVRLTSLYDPLNTGVSAVSNEFGVMVINTVPAAVPTDPPVTVSMTLRDLTVTHLTPDGYLTTITTDITINMPDFNDTNDPLNLREVAAYAIVARGNLTNWVPATVNGSIYAGSADISQARLTLATGTMVCRDDIIVRNGADGSRPGPNTGQFIVSPGARLWAGRIVVGGAGAEGGAGAVSLNGITFVEDDLDLRGLGASAWLAGQYFGFGTSRTEATQSSAILVNGRGSMLDMSGLNFLLLGGHSFIQQDGGIFTGQSLTVRSDQLAYLVPARVMAIRGNPDLPRMNPTLTRETDIEIDYDEVLWRVGGEEKRLRDYFSAADIASGNSIRAFPVDPDQPMGFLYYYLNFTGTGARERANAFFKDYFAAHPGEMQTYFDMYLPIYEAAGRTASAGVTYGAGMTTAGRNPLTDAGSWDTIADLTAEFRTQFRNLCSTLSPNTYEEDTDPYGSLVRRDPALPAVTTEFFLDGEDGIPVVAALVGGADIVLNLDDPRYRNVRIVICDGNVVVRGVNPFNGLILSGGNVRIEAGSINASRLNDLMAAMFAENTDLDRRVIDYLNFNLNAAAEADGNRTWDLAAIVQYENRRRH